MCHSTGGSVQLEVQLFDEVSGRCRAQKLVDTTMLELGVPGPPNVPTRATCGAYLALRAEVIAMLELRKTLQHRYKPTGDSCI